MDLKIIYNFENFQLMNIRTEGESESKFTEQFVYTLNMIAVVYSLFLLAATTYECNWHNIVWFEEYIIHYMLLRRQHKQSQNKPIPLVIGHFSTTSISNRYFTLRKSTWVRPANAIKSNHQNKLAQHHRPQLQRPS